LTRDPATQDVSSEARDDRSLVRLPSGVIPSGTVSRSEVCTDDVVLPAPIPFIAHYAARKGFRYNPEGDERWMRVWEPYATLKTPLRYEHVVESTGEGGSFTVARFVVPTLWGSVEGEASAWIAVVQDPRIDARAAATSDGTALFGEVVPLTRRGTGDARFDHFFASFADTDDALARAITPSLRKLVLGWQTALHFELRPGGFIMAPVALPPHPESLSWLVRSLPLFGDKASKR
jgi:hypothetical protein